MAELKKTNNKSLLNISKITNREYQKLSNKTDVVEKPQTLKIVLPHKITSINQPLIIKNYGIDLLRIVAMNSILIHHLIYHIVFKDGRYKTPRNSSIIWILHYFNQWHVDAFCLISGVVGYKKCRYSKLFYYWFYAFFILLV